MEENIKKFFFFNLRAQELNLKCSVERSKTHNMEYINDKVEARIEVKHKKIQYLQRGGCHEDKKHGAEKCGEDKKRDH